MPGEPLGISFSPFAQQPNGPSQTGYNPGAPASPQEPIQVRNLRLPRTVGAAPVAAPLLRSPGSAAFGPAGGNLDQLLELLFGQRRTLFGAGGTNGAPASPQNTLFGNLNQNFGLGFGMPEMPRTTFPGSIVPGGGNGLPWERPTTPLPGFTFERPPAREGDANVPPPTLTGPNGEPYSPPSAGPLPWERSGAIDRGDRFRV